MLITLTDLEREPLEFKLSLEPGAIDYGVEIAQFSPLAVEGRADLLEENRGPKEIVQDIRLRGSFSGQFEIPCARCLTPVRHPLQGSFDLLFRPLNVEDGSPDHSISTSETEIGYYQEGSLTLEDVLREQVLLSLPARTLCREDCKGLCPRCGQDLNSEPCNCDAAPADPRWSALSELGSRIKK